MLDLYHSDDPTHSQQEFAFYNHYYQSYYYLPLIIFKGTSHALVTAYLRPGTRSTGAENAMILVCLAVPVIHEARRLHQQRVALAQARGEAPPASSRLYEEFTAAALSWAQRWRVVLKAEVMSAGDNPRFVVTSLDAPTPQMVYEDLYCARGNCENDIKALKCDLHSERTSVTTFLAKAMRLILACAAYALHHALRTSTLQHTALAQPNPRPSILTLFKMATQIRQYKDRILLHLPSSCPVKALLQRVTTLLYVVPELRYNTS